MVRQMDLCQSDTGTAITHSLRIERAFALNHAAQMIFVYAKNDRILMNEVVDGHYLERRFRSLGSWCG